MRIKKGDIVRIDQTYITTFKKNDLSSTVDYVVYSVVKDNFIATIYNPKTKEFRSIYTYNLIKIRDGKDSSL